MDIMRSRSMVDSSYIINRRYPISRYFKTPVTDMACTLRAYNKEAVQGLVLRGSLHRYLPVLLHMKEVRMAEIPVRWFHRKHGESKYRIIDRLFSTVRDFFMLFFKREKVLENRDREYRIKEQW